MKYYLHDTGSFDDEKVAELFINYGYEGVGLFYVILEKLAKQEKPIKTTVLKSQLKVGKRLEKCWNFMESLGVISSLNGETFNERLLNFSEKYQNKKEKTAKKVSEWREKQVDAKNVTGYETICNAPNHILNHIPNHIPEVTIPDKKENEEKKVPNGIDFFEKNLHSKFIEIYVNWYYKKIGAKYKFSGGADGTAAKQMINYIRAAQKEKNGYESSDEEILNAWEFILNNWAKWESFYQGQLKLSQINSNMANIMANIKGISKNGNNLTAKDDWNEITRIIATMGK